MNPSLSAVARHISRRTYSNNQNGWRVAVAATSASSANSRWICPSCTRSLSKTRTISGAFDQHRRFSASSHRLDEIRSNDSPIARTPFTPKPPESGNPPIINTTADLPSKSDSRRWQISRRMATLMDSILARASVAGQHINVYTGTDYSGIEAIKKEISDQEEKVDECHATIDKARSNHREAHTKQASSQKEIVSLLERKASWSPEDLDRYMALVRSEHTDEQAVQAAKDGLSAAERELENSRAELERMERKQYHEEQIWSDTIRRNSTWVTFGLMGLNILLLLTQIAIFEPYRRRKIVKEVQKALDEKAIAHVAPEVERQIDAVVEPVDVPLEVIAEGEISQSTSNAPVASDLVPSKTLLAAGKLLPRQNTPPAAAASSTQNTRTSETSLGRWESYKEHLRDLFSERLVEVKKVDMTTTALQGAATGVAAMGMLFVLWRPW